MANLIAIALKWLGRNLGLFLLILACVVLATWLRGEWRELRAVQERVEAQRALVAARAGELGTIEAELAREAKAWRAQVDALAAPLRDELAGLGARAERARPAWERAQRAAASLDAAVAGTQREADEARRRLEALERESRFWDPLLNRERLLALEAARAQAAALEGTARATRALRDRTRRTLDSSPVQALLGQRDALERRIEALSGSASPRQLELAKARAEAQRGLGAERASLGDLERRAAQDPRQKLLARLRDALPAALAIFAAALLVPLALKALFYFVLAPAAARLPPIRILPDERAAPVPTPQPSAVSVAVDVEPDQELLVRPEFLQSSARPSVKRTRWFLNPRLPFASLASGMFALTAVRPERAAATRVVVSSQQDALGEVALLELPAGAAMVLQPRSLAGVVTHAGAPVRITRHWRATTLHAWLTLQLRYLVFHGPCRLVLKGTRGVRAEEPTPGQPRLLNQAATLGFSANLDYQVARTETFVPYLRGREALFNDLFSGGPGRFVYEEMPAGGRRAGIAGRGLEGVVDAVLDAFGI